MNSIFVKVYVLTSIMVKGSICIRLYLGEGVCVGPVADQLCRHLPRVNLLLVLALQTK